MATKGPLLVVELFGGDANGRKMIARGRIPGELMMRSQRLFRMLRPLCIDVPVKLSLHDSLPNV